MDERQMDQIARGVVSALAAPRDASTADVSWRMPLQRPRPNPVESTRVTGLQAAGHPVRVAGLVDHTLLKAEGRRGEIDTLCGEALEHEFAAVCVNAAWVGLCASRLVNSPVMVATVVGFPLGAMTTASKAYETRQAVDEGADEIDMVVAVGHLLDGDWDYVEDDIAAVVASASGRRVKVILETGLLEPLQIVKASAIAREAGASFVKTSTGFHASGGATAEAVALMRMAVGDALGVKASGGVRDCATALRMVAAGATRLGTSSGVKFARCIGSGPRSLADLIADPSMHEHVCQTGDCPATY